MGEHDCTQLDDRGYGPTRRVAAQIVDGQLDLATLSSDN